MSRGYPAAALRLADLSRGPLGWECEFRFPLSFIPVGDVNPSPCINVSDGKLAKLG